MGARKKPTLKSLSHGRPPNVKSTRTMSRKATRTLINTHHQLEKKKHQAREAGHTESEAAITAELAKLGGIEHYQQASLQGQSHDRGGDTSKTLLDWLPLAELRYPDRKLRMLEVGALSTRNACSASGVFDMVYIDLNSQEPGIEHQDFMELPLPSHDSEKFDLISLSLVLNFAPEPAGRGEMLRRTLSFLRPEAKAGSHFPSLFIVLPRSCVDNSRYFTDPLFDQLMASLGYARQRSKSTQKLAYSLWKRVDTAVAESREFLKREINPGKTRNNFSIILRRSML